MDRFSEIEKKYSGIGVRAVDDVTLSGILSLKGRDTNLILTGDHPYRRDVDQNGWFDVSVQASNGELFLLHNALEIKHVSHSGNRSFETHIYPNIVVVGHSDNINTVKSISFKLKGLKHFFHYQHVERQSTYKMSSEIKNALLKLRGEDKYNFGIEREYDFFRPDEIYISHNVPRVFKFFLNERYYEIGIGGYTRGLGWSGVELNVEPIARISFALEATIDEALDAMWEWRQFFVQVAMMAMPVEAISTLPDKSHTTRTEIFLPAREASVTAEGRHSIHPAYIPFNRWKDRRQLASVTQRWLSKQHERRIFRNALNSVIVNMHKRSEVDNVVRLCSALESLPELKPQAKITKLQVKTMAEAAAAAINASSEIRLSAERLQNVLSALRRPSLAERFNLLIEAISPEFPTEQCKTVADLAYRFRNDAAHGKQGEAFESPIVGPVVEALTSMCVFYDLKTSGVPARWNETSLPCLNRWHDNFGALQHLLKHQETPS